jgi:hypothetical protein
MAKGPGSCGTCGRERILSHPARSLVGMDRDQWCEHKPVWVGRVAVAACDECGRVDWLSNEGPVDHAEAIAALFGTYDLAGAMEALGAPSPEVLVYTPPSARKRRHLDALPRRAWLKAGPQLWMSTDGEVLLLATTQRQLFENLTRGA